MTMMQECISITGMGSISPLGTSVAEIWQKYTDSSHCFHKENTTEYTAALSENAQLEVVKLISTNSKYKNLDNSVGYACL